MIFWRGKGILTLLAVGLAVGFAIGLLGHVFKIEPYSLGTTRGADTNIVGGTIMLLAALFNTLMMFIPGLKDRPDQIVTRADGARVKMSYKGTFMFIPRFVWSIIFGVIGIGLFIAIPFVK